MITDRSDDRRPRIVWLCAEIAGNLVYLLGNAFRFDSWASSATPFCSSRKTGAFSGHGWRALTVLGIDDWAMAPLSEPERRDFWEICEDRHQVRSTILTSPSPRKLIPPERFRYSSSPYRALQLRRRKIVYDGWT